MKFYGIFGAALLFFSCGTNAEPVTEPYAAIDTVPVVEQAAPEEEPAVLPGTDSTKYTCSWLESFEVSNTLINRIPTPAGYTRTTLAAGSFGDWLRHVPLKPGKPSVHLYDGELKWNQSAHHAVIDLDVGQRDLQQCADAVMRLRAEYLYASNAHDQIHFNYTSGDKVGFEKWSSGYKPLVKGSNVRWVASSSCNDSYTSFRKYMDNIFMYAGTASLTKELQQVPLAQIQVGDVFIKGGSPGHAVLVMDVAENTAGNKVFLVAQSYMPAQEMHVLVNPGNRLSPWYSIAEIGEEVQTPEWTFYRDQLKRFAE